MFEERTGLAWKAFHERLVQVIVRGLPDGEVLRIRVAHAKRRLRRKAPFVELTFDEDRVTVAVAGNGILGPEWLLTRAQQAILRRCGLTRSSRQARTYTQTYRRDRPDEAAWAVISAFRDAFDIVDPALLTSPDRSLTPAAKEPWQLNPAFADGARPTSREELDELVGIALANVDSTHRFDDFYVIDCHNSEVWVQSSGKAPVVRICCTPKYEAPDVAAAALLAQHLNESYYGVKFTVLNLEYMLLMIEMPVSPFVPEHLRMHVARLCQILTDWDEILPQAMEAAL